MKTLAELRKEASVLKIKNYCKFNKVELTALVEQAKAPKLPSKKGRKSNDLPREGTQAMEVYKIFQQHIGHKRWTVYRVTKDYGFSLNNVRRIYKKYFEAINKELAEKNPAEKLEL